MCPPLSATNTATIKYPGGTPTAPSLVKEPTAGGDGKLPLPAPAPDLTDALMRKDGGAAILRLRAGGNNRRATMLGDVTAPLGGSTLLGG